MGPSAPRFRTCSYAPSVPLPAAVLAVERLAGRRIWASPREAAGETERGERGCDGGGVLRHQVQLFSPSNPAAIEETGRQRCVLGAGEVDGNGLDARGRPPGASAAPSWCTGDDLTRVDDIPAA